MSNTAAATAAAPKTYNLLGPVSNVTLHTDVKDRPYATFQLVKKSDGKTVKCVVFAEHIEKIKEAVMAAKGGDVRLFGRYDRRQFQDGDKTKTAVRFRALWAGLPKAKQQEAQDDVGF